jgi:hypothetical protein
MVLFSPRKRPCLKLFGCATEICLPGLDPWSGPSGLASSSLPATAHQSAICMLFLRPCIIPMCLVALPCFAERRMLCLACFRFCFLLVLNQCCVFTSPLVLELVYTSNHCESAAYHTFGPWSMYHVKHHSLDCIMARMRGGQGREHV